MLSKFDSAFSRGRGLKHFTLGRGAAFIYVCVFPIFCVAALLQFQISHKAEVKRFQWDPEQRADPMMISNQIATPSPNVYRHVYLPMNDSKLLYLVSFPGSGNTWVIHSIQVGTLAFAGSVYQEYYKRAPDSTVIVIKSHDPCESCGNTSFSLLQFPISEDFAETTTFAQTCKFCDSIKWNELYYAPDECKSAMFIHLVRNPFNAIFAYFCFAYSGDRLRGVPSDYIIRRHFAAFFREQFPIWKRHTARYSRCAALTVHYENVQKSPEIQFVRMLSFLKKHRPDDLHNISISDGLSRIVHDQTFLPPRLRLSIKTQILDAICAEKPESLRSWACREIGPLWNAQVWGECLTIAEKGGH